VIENVGDERLTTGFDLSTGSLLRETLERAGRNWRWLLAPTVLATLSNAPLVVLQVGDSSRGLSPTYWLLVCLLNLPIGALTSGTVAAVTLDSIAGWRPDLRVSIRLATSRYLPLLLTTLLSALPQLLALEAVDAFRVPAEKTVGVVAWAWASYLIPYAAATLTVAYLLPLSGPVLKEGAGSFRAFGRTLVLTRGVRLRGALGYLSLLIGHMIALVLAAAVAGLAGGAASAAYAALSAIVFGMVDTLAAVLGAVAYVRFLRRAGGVAADDVDRVFG
jgi:hypothetical protein